MDSQQLPTPILICQILTKTPSLPSGGLHWPARQSTSRSCYAHSEDLLAEVTSLIVLYGPAWKVRLEGPRLYLTVDNMRCKAMHKFATTLVQDYGCAHAIILRNAATYPG